MSTTLPKSQAILNYQDFYNTSPPDIPLNLIKGLCKTTILGEFAGLNYRLKPKTTMYYDTTFETQYSLLFYFSGSNQQLFENYYRLYARHIVSKKDYPLIFTRQTCLYAIEQIINSDMTEVEGFSMTNSWQQLFQYLLMVNLAITKQSNEISENPLNLEELSPKLLPLNELSINVNPLYTPFRGYQLLEYLSIHPHFGIFFKEYFERNYKIPFDHFIYELLSMYYANNRDGVNDIFNEITGEKLDTSFFYSVKLNEQALFNSLSLLFENEKTERLISIKKYPFFKTPDNKYLLIDSVLLIDKSYSQFINDFWFDCINSVPVNDGKPAFDNRYYRGEIGYFVEKYTRDIFNHCFRGAKYHTIKTFDELKTKSTDGENELADVYLRYTKKIFIAQVKSTGLYDEEKYSGDINEMYKNDRVKFFQSFGVNQIVKSIENLETNIKDIDKGFPINSRCQIFPSVIVNEKAMQTPLMAYIFNKRFNELMKEIKVNNFVVHPLSLIHVSDLEHMEDYLHLNPMQFFKILRYHLRNPSFIPPFYNTLILMNIKPNFRKTKQLFERLILKYQRK